MTLTKHELLERLTQLQNTKTQLEENGPDSEQGQTWLANTRTCLQLADRALADEFIHLMQFVVLPLSLQKLPSTPL